jgi:Fe-S oxidoreductase
LAEKTLLLEEFIAREQAGKHWQLAFQPLPEQRRWLVHGHCHQKAVGAMKAMRKVLKMIPELDATPIEASCCGMAGHFGLESEHYAVSQAMAKQALFPALSAEPQAAGSRLSTADMHSRCISPSCCKPLCPAEEKRVNNSLAVGN